MLRFLTAGESHGKALTAVVEGLPAGLAVSEEDINPQMLRRQQGYGRSVRMKLEADRVEIVSGLMAGRAIGGPVALRIENRDARVSEPPLTRPRPGHADLVGSMKFGFEDARRALERASARETAARVAAGTLCRKLLHEFGIEVSSHVVEIGGVAIRTRPERWDDIPAAAEASELRCVDPGAEEEMRAAIDDARKRGDTLGGVFEVVALGVPPGLGSYVHWDRKLDGRLAQAVMSIHAIKGVEIGDGFISATRNGTEVQDFIRWGERHPIRLSNHAGGTEGGITNGEPVVVRAAMKPIATTVTPQPSVDMKTHDETVMQYVRSDICAVPAAAVVVEAMVSFVLADAYLEKFGGDNVAETRTNMESFLSAIGWTALV